MRRLTLPYLQGAGPVRMTRSKPLRPVRKSSAPGAGRGLERIDFVRASKQRNRGALPDGLVIGPMRSGTTWVYRYLGHRGDVGLPEAVKETFFFDEYWPRGLDWYRRRFPDGGAGQYAARLEVAPSYFHHPAAPERIRQALGPVPLVVTLRDPVERAWSHYIHYRRYGYTRAPLQEAAEAFPEILEASRYRTCLRRWQAAFPGSCLHILDFDTLASAPSRYAEQLCACFGLKPVPVPDSLRRAQHQAGAPYAAWLARLGSTAACRLRERGLYRGVSLAKALGLKRVFFGRSGSARQLRPGLEERRWLARQLAGEEVPAEPGDSNGPDGAVSIHSLSGVSEGLRDA